MVDLARPDEHWWLSFATDAAPRTAAALLAHPEARTVPAIGRALVPLDELSAAIVAKLRAGGDEGAAGTGPLRLSDAALRALAARDPATREREPGASPRASASRTPREPAWRGNIEVERHADEPVFVLLGDPLRLPGMVRDRAASVPGGAALALTLESWRLIRETLDGWPSPAALRCGAALRMAGRRRQRCSSSRCCTTRRRSCSCPATNRICSRALPH